MIGIIGAMAVEVESLVSKMKLASFRKVADMDFACGELFGKDVVVARCGIGKVAAALCAQAMILYYDVSCIINTGVAGTLSEDLGILDFAISSGVVEHDVDTSPIGDPLGLISGINIIEIPANKRLCDLAVRIGKAQGNHCLSGIIASGDQFIHTNEKKSFIRSQFGAISCEMEGAAIGHTCYLYGVDFVVIRCISDSASGDAVIEYPELVGKAAAKSQALVEAMLNEM